MYVYIYIRTYRYIYIYMICIYPIYRLAGAGQGSAQSGRIPAGLCAALKCPGVWISCDQCGMKLWIKEAMERL